MKLNTALGYLGAAVLAIGTFVPLLSSPMGSYNAWSQPDSVGIWVLLLALAGGALVFLKRDLFVAVAGALAFVVVTIDAISINDKINQVKQLAGAFSGAVDAFIHIDAGMYFMFVGAGLLIVSPFAEAIKGKLSNSNTAAGE